MAQSFFIFFVIAGVILLIFIGLVGIAYIADFIWPVIILMFGVGMLAGGVYLLVNVGGGPGAFGIFLILLGGYISKFAAGLLKEEIERFKYRR